MFKSNKNNTSMIFHDTNTDIPKSKVGDNVKVISQTNSDSRKEFTSEIFHIYNIELNCPLMLISHDTFTMRGFYTKGEQYALSIASHDHSYIFKLWICNKLYRIIPI